MSYWPGTNVPKSLNNEFNWQRGESKFLGQMREYIRQSKAGTMGGQITRQYDNEKSGYMTPVEKPYQKTFTVYSKAKPTKFNGKGDKV